MFQTLDGYRTFNVVEALLQDDVLLGYPLEENGLESVRVQIMQESRPSVSGHSGGGADGPRGLYNGALLEMDEDGGLGLTEAPLG